MGTDFGDPLSPYHTFKCFACCTGDLLGLYAYGDYWTFTVLTTYSYTMHLLLTYTVLTIYLHNLLIVLTIFTYTMHLLLTYTVLTIYIHNLLTVLDYLLILYLRFTHNY